MVAPRPKKKYPLIRINRLANKRADEIVKAFDALGIEVTKSQFVSELILATPIPMPMETPKRKAKSGGQAAAPKSIMMAGA